MSLPVISVVWQRFLLTLSREILAAHAEELAWNWTQSFCCFRWPLLEQQLHAPVSSGSQAWCLHNPCGMVGLFCSRSVLVHSSIFHWEEGWCISNEFEAISLSPCCVRQMKMLKGSCSLSSERHVMSWLWFHDGRETLIYSSCHAEICWVTKLFLYTFVYQLST